MSVALPEPPGAEKPAGNDLVPTCGGWHDSVVAEHAPCIHLRPVVAFGKSRLWEGGIYGAGSRRTRRLITSLITLISKTAVHYIAEVCIVESPATAV